MDLDIDQRGCIVFPKSVRTDWVSRISGAVTQPFLRCSHLPSLGPSEVASSPFPQGGALVVLKVVGLKSDKNGFKCAVYHLLRVTQGQLLRRPEPQRLMFKMG